MVLRGQNLCKRDFFFWAERIGAFLNFVLGCQLKASPSAHFHSSYLRRTASASLDSSLLEDTAMMLGTQKTLNLKQTLGSPEVVLSCQRQFWINQPKVLKCSLEIHACACQAKAN